VDRAIEAHRYHKGHLEMSISHLYRHTQKHLTAILDSPTDNLTMSGRYCDSLRIGKYELLCRHLGVRNVGSELHLSGGQCDI
jgi:hypothetical protein